MTNFDDCIDSGKAKKTGQNKARAISLIKSSTQAIETAKSIPINSNSAKTVFRELYEGLRENCEAIGFMKGYKFLDHKSIGYFLRDILKKQRAYNKFERYRKLRNGINYYGNDISIETVKEAVQEIPALIKDLSSKNKIQEKPL